METGTIVYYIIYTVIIIALAIGGWYLGDRLDCKYIGAGAGVVVGIGLSYVMHGFVSSRDEEKFMAY